jgi:hypothetical protein
MSSTKTIPASKRMMYGVSKEVNNCALSNNSNPYSAQARLDHFTSPLRMNLLNIFHFSTF